MGGFLNPEAADPRPNDTEVARLWAAILARRVRIAAVVLVVGVLAAGVALWLKPWYAAEARLLPPIEGGDLMSNLAGAIESSALSQVGLFPTSTASDVIVEILKSRRLRESLIVKFGLMKEYKCKNMDSALMALADHVSVSTTTSGVVILRTEAQSKNQAADMANFMVEELDLFNREVLNTRGKSMRRFLEQQIGEAQARMLQADSAITAYELKHGVLIAGEESSMRGVSDIVSRRIALQVRRAYVMSFSSESSAEVRAIDAELEAFDRSLGPLPMIKNEGQRLTLDAAIHRRVFSMLTAQYEQARLEEMRDVPTITVLDRARPPDLKSRPRRGLIVLSAMMVALVGTLGQVWWSIRGRPANA